MVLGKQGLRRDSKVNFNYCLKISPQGFLLCHKTISLIELFDWDTNLSILYQSNSVYLQDSYQDTVTTALASLLNVQLEQAFSITHCSFAMIDNLSLPIPI